MPQRAGLSAFLFLSLASLGFVVHRRLQSPDGAPLYLQSLRYTLTNLNYSGSGGVGAGVSAVPALTADTTWSVVLLDPRDLDKMEAHDQPVPANTFVALEHANTATLLYTHEFKVRARPPSSRRWHERARAREAQ